MFRWPLRILVLMLLVGGVFLWQKLNSSPQLAIDEDLAKQAAEDGSGANDVRLEEPVDWEPNTLSQARELLCEEAFLSARERLEAYWKQYPQSGAVRVLLAEVLRRKGKLDEALEHIEAGLEKLPTQGRAYYVHARILAKRLELLATQGGAMGKLKAMNQLGPYRSALKTAIELDPQNIDARKEEILFYLFTPAVGDKKVAVEKARELQKVDAMEGDLTLARAIYYSSEEEEAKVEGLAAIRKAVETYPDSTDPNWVLGQILFDEKKYEEADKALVKVIDSGVINETYYQALYRRMRVRTKQDKFGAEVLQFVDEYLAANPCWEWAPRLHQIYCEKGRALIDLGRNEEARKALETSLEIYPGYERAEQSIRELETL